MKLRHVKSIRPLLFICREEALQKYVEKQREKAHPKAETDKVQVGIAIF